jgi:hypothetical protein
MADWVWWAWLACALITAGLGVRDIRQLSLCADDKSRAQQFLRGGGLLMVGAALGLLEFGVWATSAGRGTISVFSESDWLGNNFEVLLIISSIFAIGICDWVARAWIQSAPAEEKERTREINLFSMTFACAIGVLVLASIGSSVFTARVAQIDFARASSAVPLLHVTRALSISRELASYRAESDAIDRKIVEARDAYYLQQETIELLQSAAPNGQPPLNNAAYLAATRESERISLYHDRLVEQSLRNIRERDCVVRALAQQIATTAGWQAGEDDPEFAPPAEGSNCPYSAFGAAHFATANQLTDLVSPLLRTWMSAQLVWRAPVVLSIELVLVMGALGSLLRAATPYLVAFVGRLGGAKTYEPPEQSDYLMLTLALHVVFGMATALIFFILLKTGVSAAELTTAGTEGVEADLNPFSMAALGLLGGYSSLNVAAWIGSLGEDLTKQNGDLARENEAENDEGASEDTTGASPPVTDVEQNVAVGVMLATRDLLAKKR